MYGKEIRKARLFSKGAPVITAVDHGQTFGPAEGLVDFGAVVSKLGESDAILMAPYMAKYAMGVFTADDAPMAVLRLNWTTALCNPWNFREAHTRLLVYPEEAVSMGADIVLANLTIKSGSQAVDAENVKVFSEIVRGKEKLGIPLIGEVIPVVPGKEKKEFSDCVLKSARIAAELGADMIKTFYTGEAFGEVASGTPVPVFVLGAEKMETEDEAVGMAARAVSEGAAGIVFGRNVFQAGDPGRMICRLKKAVNGS